MYFDEQGSGCGLLDHLHQNPSSTGQAQRGHDRGRRLIPPEQPPRIPPGVEECELNAYGDSGEAGTFTIINKFPFATMYVFRVGWAKKRPPIATPQRRQAIREALEHVLLLVSACTLSFRPS